MSSVLVNENLIRRLLSDPQLRTLGCLAAHQSLVVQDGGCRTCPKKKRRTGSTRVQPVEQAKICLYQMDDPTYRQILQALKVERLIFYFDDPRFPKRVVR